MPYFALPNFKHDSGPNRIQSGPDHQGYTVLFSGVQSTGADEGIILYASPLSGTLLTKSWGFDANWRYIPSTLPGQSISLDPTPYDASGVLDTYKAARIYTRDNVAGAQAASAIGPETGRVNPRGAALQPRANVTKPETYMYYGGGAPDNQDYSPYNTPDANTAAEGKTGGGVTHRNYESSLLTNLLGSQGTSDRSQWRYHQPVHCKTFTETRRSATPGLMSSPLRYVYRGPSTSYNYNYAGELLANKGGFAPLNYDDFGGGCDIPPPCPTTTGDPLNPQPGDILRGSSFCTYVSITWYNTGSSDPIGTGDTYTIQESDYFYKIYYVVTYPNGSTAESSVDCLGTVLPIRNYDYWALSQFPVGLDDYWYERKVLLNNLGESYILMWKMDSIVVVNKIYYPTLIIQKRNLDGVELWTKAYNTDAGYNHQTFPERIACSFDNDQENIYVLTKFRYSPTPGFTPNWDGLELYKINCSSGNLVWRHVYDTGLSSANLKSTAGLYVDNYLNVVWISALSFNLSIHTAIDLDDPTDIYGSVTLNFSGSGSIVDYPDSVTMIRSADNSKLYFIWIDESNRHVIYEADSSGLSFSSTVKRISSFTSLSAGAKLACKFISARASNGSNVYIGAQGFARYADRLILYDNNFNVIKTSSSFGYVKNLTTDPTDSSIVYITVFKASRSNLLNPCGINFGSNDAFCAVYKTNGSLDTVNSCLAFTTTSGSNFIPPPDAETSDFSIASNPFVNRAVITYSPITVGVYDGDGQISGYLTVGLPVVSSGNTSNFPWPNPSGLIGAKDAVSISIASGSATTTNLVFAGAPRSTRASGSISTTVSDITGTILEEYAAINFS
jgi:hypothetical protein